MPDEPSCEACSLELTRFIRQALFGVGPTDAVTFVLLGLLVASVAFVTSLVPTLRAARVDLSVALQAE